tara:strand:- start:343 stop:672 length:330 start_codon:yes stop_codon:yes gene_type:complete
MGKKKVVAKGPSPAEVEKAQVLAERVREQRQALAAEERAQSVQRRLGVAAVVVGLPLVGWTVIYPNLISAVLAGGIFLVGIIVAVPAARPFVIKIIERLPGVKDLPDDG